MPTTKFVDFQVYCPADPYRVEKMQLTFVKQEDSWLPLPCNGCDSLNGSKPCQECCAAITLMFFHSDKVKLDLSKPISPDFSFLKDQ